MDRINLEKIQAINKYKKHQFLNNLFLYASIALACSLLIFSPIWYPSLCSSMKVFLYVTLPKIFSHFFNSKVLFIVGNLIVVVLVGESKMFSSDHSSPVSDVYYDEYVNQSRSIRKFYGHEDKNQLRRLEKTEVKNERADVDEEEEKLTLPAEELNKRANDLIARVNKQRRLEANAYE